MTLPHAKTDPSYVHPLLGPMDFYQSAMREWYGEPPRIVAKPNYEGVEAFSNQAADWCARQERASDLDAAVKAMSDEELTALLWEAEQEKRL